MLGSLAALEGLNRQLGNDVSDIEQAQIDFQDQLFSGGLKDVSREKFRSIITNPELQYSNALEIFAESIVEDGFELPESIKLLLEQGNNIRINDLRKYYEEKLLVDLPEVSNNTNYIDPRDLHEMAKQSELSLDNVKKVGLINGRIYKALDRSGFNTHDIRIYSEFTREYFEAYAKGIGENRLDQISAILKIFDLEFFEEGQNQATSIISLAIQRQQNFRNTPDARDCLKIFNYFGVYKINDVLLRKEEIIEKITDNPLNFELNGFTAIQLTDFLRSIPETE